MVYVDLVFVTQEKKTIQHHLALESGSTVRDALNESNIFLSHPETQNMAVGIYAKQVSLDTVLKDGDRVELYRPLTRDPKEKRRQQAKMKDKS